MTKAEYTIASAIAQVEKCDFECEAGPLANNTGWRWLKAQAEAGPKFYLGQWVYHEVAADVVGVKISQWVRLCVVGIGMSSDTERRTWTYSLSTDPPDAYHYGSGVQFVGIDEKKLRETAPEEQPS